ncbi:MAG: hypothetical protein H0Z35_11975 [Thermoanaerobacteraceae bacterium]|nr:hypothetical protein [Thermoanaerobacteraceae bacterium]
MLHKVNGSLKGVTRERLRRLQKQLEPLGYEFSGEFNFSKIGTIESTVNELVPICESLGWNVEKDLELTERSENGVYESRYENGRIIRKFPRGV